MFLFSNFITAVARVMDIVLTLYLWIIIARAVISWVNPDPYNQIVRFLFRATEPVLYRIRRLIPINTGGLDFSPIIALLAIIFLQSFLVKTLLQFAATLG